MHLKVKKESARKISIIFVLNGLLKRILKNKTKSFVPIMRTRCDGKNTVATRRYRAVKSRRGRCAPSGGTHTGPTRRTFHTQYNITPLQWFYFSGGGGGVKITQ